jgi:magnesium transporter
MTHSPSAAGVTYRLCSPDGSAELLDVESLARTLEHGQFIWAHIDHPVAEVIQPVVERFGVHALVAEDMSNARQRTKAESYGDSVFVVMRAARLDGEEIAKAEAQLLLAADHILTVCHGQAVTAEASLERARMVPGPLASWKLLYAVMDLIVDQLQPVASRIESSFEVLEDELFEQSFRRQRIEDLYTIKRLGLRLLSIAAPIDDLIAQLTSGHYSFVPKTAYAHFRDIADHSKRLVEEAGGLKEMVDSALSVNLALVTVGQNEIVKRLAGWGAVLAVPTMVFSLYGMNFVDMPELKWHYGYPATLIGVLLLSWALYDRLKKAGWL